MKITQIEVSKLFNTGNYEHVKYGVTVQLEQGESEVEAVARAEKFIEQFNPKREISEYEYQQAFHIVANKRDYTIGKVEAAEETIKQYQNQSECLPF